MANSASHAALPYPIKNARFSILIPYLDADGDPTDPTTPDTEVSKDAGAFADCTEEVATISGSNGVGYLTLTGAETNCSMLALAAKVASGPKNTLATMYPRVLPVIESGTAQAGAAGTITLASAESAIDDYYVGCIIKTTGGTGGGGTGGANNQARIITDYVGATKVASVAPDWETNPSSDTTYEVLLTENAYCLLADVRAFGAVGSTQSGGRPEVNTTQFAGQTVAAAAGVTLPSSVASPTNITAGTITTVTNLTNAPTAGDLTAAMKASVNAEADTALSDYGALKPTTSGRTLDVSAGGEAGLDWANIGSPTTVQGLSGTTVKTATDVEADTQDIQNRLPAALTGAGNIKADALAVSGDATAADNAESFFDGTGYAGTNNVIPTVTTLTNAPSDSSGVTTLLSRLSALRAGYLDNLSAGAVALEASLQGLITTIGASAAGVATAVWGAATRLLTAGTNIVLAKGTGVTGFNDPTAGAIADQVWEEPLADHSGTAGSTAAALNAAGSAGDPWNTALPGAYGSGSAGKIIGENLNATVSSRATQTSVDDVPTNAELATALGTADDAVLAAIAALNNLSQANIRTAVGLGSANLDTQLTGISDKTTNLPSDPADQSLIIAATTAITNAIAALNNLSQANVRTAVGLATANLDTQLDALPTAAENAAGLLDLANGIETSLTLRGALRLITAASAGKLSGAATTTITVRNVGDSKARITATVDADGNRSAVTTDAT